MRIWRLLVKLTLFTCVAFPLLIIYNVLSFDSSVQDNLDHFQSSFDRHKKTSFTEEGTRNNDSNITSPQPILLLTYQRAGSSFLGQLFNNNPRAFYWFEPGDGIYSHVYGTAPGWAVRDDITNYRNGSRRVQSDLEIDTVAGHLYDMYTCDTTRFPTAMLTHVFLKQFHREQRSLSAYTECWHKATKESSQKSCRKVLSHTCPARYGGNPDASEACRHAIRAYNSRQSLFGYNSHRINQYFLCMKRLSAAVAPCLPHITSKCSSSDMIVLKTVRISMPVVERLILELPELKVIHYMRDPRSVALSRLKHASFRGVYAEKSLVKTAELYCQDVVRDIKLRQALQTQYPSNFYDTYFEELATFPVLTAQRIYRMLDKPLPPEVRSWLGNNTRTVGKGRTTRDSLNIVSKWKEEISDEQLQDVNNVCKNLFDTVNMDWVDM